MMETWQLDLIEKIKAAQQGRQSLIVAIDGRSGAGKTTTAQWIRRRLGAEVFHMDDFFLRPEQRTEQRMSLPGENVDHERFLKEVLTPLTQGRPVRYRPFSCRDGRLLGEIVSEPSSLTVIEGCYACHPTLNPFYDVRVFLDIDPSEQLERIERRNGACAAKTFRDKWIPLEEQYFETFSVRHHCALYYDISKKKQEQCMLI